MGDISPDLIRSISSLGATGILTVVLYLFIRGDILSRTVYEKMTVKIVEQVVAEVSATILAGVRDMMAEWETDSARREAMTHWEMGKLRREKQQLVEEMEWDNPSMKNKNARGENDV